jgi:2-keto-3-deoxy-L-rhamnonate aldolase RhmA
LVGRCDMSGSLGRLGDVDCPQIWNAVKRIFKAANQRGIPCGNALGGVGNIKRTLELGCPLVILGDDISFLKERMEHSIKAFQEVMEEWKSGAPKANSPQRKIKPKEKSKRISQTSDGR